MNTEKYLNFNTEDFLLDNDFVKWVQHPDQENDHQWAEFLENNPEKRKSVRDAILILKALRPVEPEVQLKKPAFLLESLQPQTSSRTAGFYLARIAAVLLFLISIGGLFYYLNSDNHRVLVEISGKEKAETGKIILPDGSVHEFETEVTRIQQGAGGELKLNEDTIVKNVNDLKNSKLALNQIYIPYGKRSDIMLPDGTHIWLNSGSRFSYPPEFLNNSREVFLSGEAFFDVKNDPSRPFFVVTKDIRVKVLGTRFNISSYPEDLTAQTVLLTGKITAGKNKMLTKTIELAPGERLVYEKSTEYFVKDKVDVKYYSSWVNGYLIFKNEPVIEIFKKLERFYNQTIVVEKGLENLTYSGKLDLVESLENVLDNISFTSSFIFNYENGIFRIKL